MWRDTEESRRWRVRRMLRIGQRSRACCPTPALCNVAGDLALVGVPKTTEVASSVTRERYGSDRSSAGGALDFRS